MCIRDRFQAGKLGNKSAAALMSRKIQNGMDGLLEYVTLTEHDVHIMGLAGQMVPDTLLLEVIKKAVRPHEDGGIKNTAATFAQFETIPEEDRKAEDLLSRLEILATEYEERKQENKKKGLVGKKPDPKAKRKGGKGRGKAGKSDKVCYHCGVQGHIQTECWAVSYTHLTLPTIYSV